MAKKSPETHTEPVAPVIVASPTTVVPPTSGRKPAYLSNKELLAEIHRAKAVGHMTDKLARMLKLLCSKYAKRGNFVNYSYNEDMQSYAMLMLVRTWNSFNPAKSNNPFAFFTQCIKNSFKQYLNQEKRQRVIKDEMLVDLGMDPSYGFENMSDKDGRTADDEQDFDVMLGQAETLKKIEFEEAPIMRNEAGEEIIEVQHDDSNS